MEGSEQVAPTPVEVDVEQVLIEKVNVVFDNWMKFVPEYDG